MRNTKYATLVTTFKIMVRHRKYWATATQRTLLNLLERYHALKISRRQLNYHLADLRRDGYIKTIRRYDRRPGGQIILLASAHCITPKGYRLLISLGVREAWHRLKELKRRYLKEPPRTKTQDEHPQNQEITPKKTGTNPFLNPEFRRKKGLKGQVPFAV